MRKALKKTIALLLAMILTAIAIQPVTAYANTEVDMHNALISELGQEVLNNHVQSMQILDEFYSLLPTSRGGMIIYPEYFGGRYINENGQLVFLHVISREEHSMPTIAQFDNVLTRYVEFTFNELRDVANVLDALTVRSIAGQSPIQDISQIPIYGQSHTYISADNIFTNVGGWSLDVAENRVLVYLVDYSEQAISVFNSSILSSEAIKFRPFQDIVLYESFDVENIEREIEELNRYFPEPLQMDDPIMPRMLRTLRTGDQVRFWRRGFGWLPNLGIGYRAFLRFNNGARIDGFITAAHSGVHLATWLRNGDIVTDLNNFIIGIV